jgi:hypothetical protein
VGAVSQQAMQKLINRKSLNSNEMIGYVESDSAAAAKMDHNDGPRRINKMKGVSCDMQDCFCE